MCCIADKMRGARCSALPPGIGGKPGMSRPSHNPPLLRTARSLPLAHNRICLSCVRETAHAPSSQAVLPARAPSLLLLPHSLLSDLMAASQNTAGGPGTASHASDGSLSACLQGHQLLDSRYECIEALGRGAFGASAAPSGRLPPAATPGARPSTAANTVSSLLQHTIPHCAPQAAWCTRVTWRLGCLWPSSCCRAGPTLPPPHPTRRGPACAGLACRAAFASESTPE